MKKKASVFSVSLFVCLLALICLFCSAAAAEVEVNADNFPDKAFREYVQYHFDKDEPGKSGYGILSDDEILSATGIYIYDNKDLKSLEGIQYLTALQYLTCCHTGLEELDVSANTGLIEINCADNKLTALTVGDKQALTALKCYSNKLTALDVSSAPKLAEAAKNPCNVSNINGSTVHSFNKLAEDGKTVLAELSVDELVTITAGGFTSPARIVEISGANFPDDGFRGYLTENVDHNGDGWIGRGEEEDTRNIHLEEVQISSLQGIELLPKLEGLYCQAVPLKSLDVSKNEKLTYLQLWNVPIETLKLRNALLQTLDCNACRSLTALDVSGCPELTKLSCTETGLTSLDLKENKKLTYVSCDSGAVGKLTLPETEGLATLSCSGNLLTSLDLSSCTGLTRLYCASNRLTELDLSGNTALTELYCQSNQLSELDVSKNEALRNLSCGWNKLTSLKPAGKAALTALECEHNLLTALDVSGETALKTLTCGANRLTELKLTGTASLEELDCFNNQLAALDVSACKALKELNCSSNRLTVLKTAGNKALQVLNCSENQLQKLDVSSSKLLTSLSCGKNLLSSLDAAACTALAELDCSENMLKTLKITGLKKLGTLICHTNTTQKLDVRGCTLIQTVLKKGTGERDGRKVSYTYKDNTVFLDAKVEITADSGVIPAVIKLYTVTVTAADGGSAAVRGDILEFETGDTVYLSLTVNPGYEFKKWKVTAGDVTVADNNTFEMGEADVEIKALFQQKTNTYTLTVDYRKEDGSEAAKSYVAAYAEGGNYDVRSPAVEGYTPDRTEVSGVMGTEDVTELVIYTKKNDEPPASYDDETGHYEIADGEATWSPADRKASKVSIPAKIRVNDLDYPVTAVANNACKGMKKLTSVTIGSNVATIGKNAFSGCASLKTVKLGSKLTAIGEAAFRNCTKITQIVLPSKVNRIGKNAFNGCRKLKTITIKTAKLTKAGIGKNCFKGISAKATFKCPKKKLKDYKAWLLKTGGAPKTASFK